MEWTQIRIERSIKSCISMQLRIKLRGSESMNKSMNKEQMQNILNSRVHQEEIDKRLIAASTL